MKYIAPSILSADFTNLGQQIRLIEIGGADWIHCDVMDGHFVPNITFGPMMVNAVKRCSDRVIDVHLMIEHPEKYIESFVKAGADYLTIHQEAVVHLDRALHQIRESGAKPGVSINPSTPVSMLENILGDVELVLLMSVNPGFGGQEFIPNTLKKIRELVKLREQTGTNFLIEVDGGINKKTISQVSDAGCDVFVAGSSIFNSDNISAATTELRGIINN